MCLLLCLLLSVSVFVFVVVLLEQTGLSIHCLFPIADLTAAPPFSRTATASGCIVAAAPKVWRTGSMGGVRLTGGIGFALLR